MDSKISLTRIFFFVWVSPYLDSGYSPNLGTKRPNPRNRVRFLQKALFFCVTFIKAINATFGIHEFRGSGEERVAGGTEVDMHFFNGRTGLHHVTAGACNFCIDIFWMDFFIHFLHSLLKRASFLIITGGLEQALFAGIEITAVYETILNKGHWG